MGVLDSLEGGARQAVEVFIAVVISVIFFSIALPAILDAFREARESVPILPLASPEFLLALFLVITVILGFLGLCELAHLGYSDLLKGVALVIAGLAILSLLIRTQNKLVAEISGEYAKIIVATASGILVSVLAYIIRKIL
ncbi:MAG: hypothetical protein QW290_09145 [Sulfolobales archaeon]